MNFCEAAQSLVADQAHDSRISHFAILGKLLNFSSKPSNRAR
jgi:hypothetical protein